MHLDKTRHMGHAAAMNPLLTATLFAAVCGAAAPRADAQVMADFSMPEINTTSLRRAVTDKAISPRDYIHQVTAWYFASET